MAVPANCSQNVSAKLNTLFSITMVRISSMIEVGKLHGRLSVLSRIRLLMESTARCVSMLVYIEVASAENKRALVGIVNSFNSFMTVVESLT